MVRNPALVVAIATLFTGFEILVISSNPGLASPDYPVQISQDIQKPLPPASSSTTKKPIQPIDFGLVDGTPVKLKFKQTVSSKTANANDPVEFEVVESVKVGSTIVIARGAIAKGLVTDVQRSGMLGRRGKLEVAVKEVELVTGERVTLRASKESGGGNSGGIIAVAVLVTPLALLFKGKNITYEAGTEIQAFVDGNFELEQARFSRLNWKYSGRVGRIGSIWKSWFRICCLTRS
jgi:hypothetical protein